MQQFTVPQFIDVEDKIIGPITVRQFIIIIIAGLILFVEYKLSDFAFFIVVAIPTIVLFGVVAFAKINGMPFHYFVINVIQTLKKPNIRVWQRQVVVPTVAKKENKKQEVRQPVTITRKSPVSKSHLSDLSLVIDTGGVYLGQDQQKNYEFKNS